MDVLGMHISIPNEVVLVASDEEQRVRDRKDVPMKCVGTLKNMAKKTE